MNMPEILNKCYTCGKQIKGRGKICLCGEGPFCSECFDAHFKVAEWRRRHSRYREHSPYRQSARAGAT